MFSQDVLQPHAIDVASPVVSSVWSLARPFLILRVTTVFLVLATTALPAAAANDNDGACPVVAGQEDIFQFWDSAEFHRADVNGPVTDCAAALMNYALFQGDGIADIVQMAMVQAAVEANIPLGSSTAAAMYQASADALCQDIGYLWAEPLSAFAMVSDTSQDLVQCAIIGATTILTGSPVFVDLSDNPTDAFPYFGPTGDLDGDSISNLDEWTAALAAVGISTTNVYAYDDAQWGLVWENSKRGGSGGDTALKLFLASNGLTLPNSVYFFALPGTVTSPPPTPSGQLRIASWNIEFLNTRIPARSPQQLDALAQRMARFDAAIFCLQEIEEKNVLEDVMAAMGPSYTGIYWDSQNAIVYDENRLLLVDSELLDFLTDPPYSTYATDYPGATDVPFPPDRLPVTAVFRSPSSPETFRVISYHGHWSSALCRHYEGLALNRYVTELLADADETHRIFIAGDYNGQPGLSPEAELTAGGLMVAIPSENGDLTSATDPASIDHISATPAGAASVPDGSLYVVRPRLFGEADRDFESTYSDHLPLLMEIMIPVQMPTASGQTLVSLAVIIALLALSTFRRASGKRRG